MPLWSLFPYVIAILVIAILGGIVDDKIKQLLTNNSWRISYRVIEFACILFFSGVAMWLLYRFFTHHPH